ncbi:MAG: tetratricopeptide repeat protein [Fusobacterium sp. JB021]|nr:tetratricopeptide repeat protein [Fusobacterium sp. JB020]MDP0493226.1 tetratricopeptide repeat protein [Fusobacterium sp. JB021]MDP0506260.1 tetratricopeptide repeat protein [Fusobacterium sp. JB019]
MKKFLYLIILTNLFYSCQNLNTVKQPKIIKPSILVQDNFILNNSGINYFLDITKDNIKNKTSRTYLTNNHPEVYLGEYAIIPIDNIDSFSKEIPKVQSYDAFIKDNNFYFRSIYQGFYSFSFIKDNQILKTITINNISRYKISKANLENMISENITIKDLENLENSVTLFKMLFPENSKNKEFSIALLDLAIENSDINIFKKESKYLENNFDLSSLEKIKIINGKTSLLKENIPFTIEYLNFKENSKELNDYIKRAILKKIKPTAQELLFLEACYTKERTLELTNQISSFYKLSNNPTKANYYKSDNSFLLPLPIDSTIVELENLNNSENIKIDSPSEDKANISYKNALNYYKNKSYAEAILAFEKAKLLKTNSSKIEDVNFYLGMSYYNSNNTPKAIDKLKLVDENNSNYPEALYRLGDLNAKQGNKAEAIKLFNQVKNLFPKTIWGRKSSIYLLKIN